MSSRVSRAMVARATIGLALILAMPAAFATAAAPTCDPGDSGCLIFNGQRTIPAHLRDDNRALPAWTTRCINCHTQNDPSTSAFAPPLTHDALLTVSPRRGGPPSSYDLATFCRAVKNSIDPTEILLRKSMPQYQLSDAECAALWQFVTHR